MVSYNTVAFYVCAHQDDWQFFRGEQAYKDLNYSGAKIVFIYTTAGDAGRTDGWWEAREQSALASVRAAIAPSPLLVKVVTINQHPIIRYECGNSVSYFMRLPDGISGNGSAAYGFTSLSQLRDHGKMIKAVDDSTQYTTWSDFCSTLQEIMQLEAVGISNPHPWINTTDFDTKINPGDHADHIATADAIRIFAKGLYNRALWEGYTITSKNENLSDADYRVKKILYDAYSRTMNSLLAANGQTAPLATFMNEWNAYGRRSYWRAIMWNQPDI